jgi:hypothetical protein
MMNSEQRNCQVVIPPEKAMGDFANAFRLVQDSGNDWFLDFLTFSESENTAVVVARVRVQGAFLAAIRDRLNGGPVPEARLGPTPLPILGQVVAPSEPN